MPRDGTGVAQVYPGSNSNASNTVIQSALENNLVNDLYALINSTPANLLAGSATNPSLTFTGDSNTGLYNVSADVIGVANGGVQHYSLSATALLGPNGTAALPGMAFLADPDTGVYRAGANQVGIATNGTGLVIFDQPNATVRPLTNGGFTLGDATHLIGGLYLQQNAGAFVGWGGTGPVIFNTSGNILTFATGTSYSFDALIDLSSGATTVGVKFPAVQIVSANANTLDDYAEGTTTPTITSGSGTFTTVSCTLTYTKTGNRVVWDAVITITTNGSAAGSIILPLPFTTGAASAASGVVVSSGVTVGGHVPVSSTTLTIRKYDGTYPGADGLTIRLGGSFRV